jgi:methionyl-tRNA formyltransferase
MVTPASLRIAYFGTPEFAVPTLRRLIDTPHRVIAVVSQPDRPRGRGQQLAPTPTKTIALAHGIEVLQPERIREDRFLERLAALAPDLGVVAAYGKLLPETLLGIPRLGLINVHASLLPRWRGAAPVHRAIIAGDEVTGVTIMRVVRELDAGAMFAARPRPIGADETSPQVESALAVMGANLLAEVVDLMASDRATETPQDETKVTLAPKIAKGEGAIDWTRPARQLHNLIRGLQPWPLVSARLEGERILLHASQPTDEIVDGPPGTVAHADGDVLAVAAGDRRALRLLSLQREGRRAISAREFLAGRRTVPGMKFENG